MIFIDTDISGVVIVEPTLDCDGRGYFFESHNQRDCAAHGIEVALPRTTSRSPCTALFAVSILCDDLRVGGQRHIVREPF